MILVLIGSIKLIEQDPFPLQTDPKSSTPFILIPSPIPSYAKTRVGIFYPGSVLKWTLSFCPPVEQLRYQGDAKFSYKNGALSISLMGLGASSQLTYEPLINFGYIKFDYNLFFIFYFLFYKWD